MKYSIHWSDQAAESLAAIREYIAVVSPARAAKVTSELVICARQLLKFPLMGVKDNRFGNDNLRKLIKDEHFLVYEVNDNRIEILDAFSDKQNFQTRFMKTE